MDVSYAWRRAIAPGIEEGPEALAQRLALRGAPVASLTALAEGLGGVVVARVEATERHPAADRLTLCTVDAGNGRRLRVVCGAPNVAAGGVYPFAPVGTVLPGDRRIEREGPLQWWERDELMSERARRSWLAPTRVPAGWDPAERGPHQFDVPAS